MTNSNPEARLNVRSWAFRVTNLRHSYTDTTGLEICNLEIPAGRITAVLGKSGSGKSTFLHLIGGMLKCVTLGSRSKPQVLVAIEGDPKAPRNILKIGLRGIEGEIGFVFQQPYLIRDASGRLNLELSLSAGGKTLVGGSIAALWDQLGLQPETLLQPARTLSGGMQQRLALGRATIRSPQIILADEPTASLDRELAHQILARLRAWQREQAGRTIVFVTHDTELASAFADAIVVLAPPSGSEEASKLGTLLPGLSWPQLNPCDPAVIGSWVEGAVRASAPGDVKTYASELRKSDPPAADRPLASAAISARREPMAFIWARIAVAQAFNAPPRLGKPHANRLCGLLHRFRDAKVVMAIVAISFVLLDMLFFGASLAGADTESASNARGHFWFLLLVPGIFLAPLTITQLGWTSLVRAAVLSVLAMTGLVAIKGLDIINAERQSKLSSADLNPLVATHGKSLLTPKLVQQLQGGLEGRGLVPVAKGTDGRRSVVGRYETDAVNVILPSVQDYASATPPQCPEEGPNLRSPSALGLFSDDPLLAHLEAHLLEGSSTLAALLERQPTNLQSRIPLDDRSLYVNADFLRELGFGIASPTPLPHWLCVDLQRTNRFMPFRITAVLSRLPSFGKSTYAMIISPDAAIAARKAPDEIDPDLDFDQVAIDLGEHSDAVLDFINEASAHHLISAEVGSEKISQALKGVIVISSLGHGASIVVLALTAAITGLFVWQFIDQNRRELIVARAFGASFAQVLILIVVLLGIPLLLAFGATTFFALTALPNYLTAVSAAFDLVDGRIADTWRALLLVFGIGGLLLTSITTVVLGAWWWQARSLASGLQEVG